VHVSHRGAFALRRRAQSLPHRLQGVQRSGWGAAAGHRRDSPTATANMIPQPMTEPVTTTPKSLRHSMRVNGLCRIRGLPRRRKRSHRKGCNDAAAKTPALVVRLESLGRRRTSSPRRDAENCRPKEYFRPGSAPKCPAWLTAVFTFYVASLCGRVARRFTANRQTTSILAQPMRNPVRQSVRGYFVRGLYMISSIAQR
jgi:hypothetical protein